MTTATDHRQISDTFLRQAQIEFAQGDLLQASEKGWGAVAHYVKAISKDRGWNNKSHDLVIKNAYRILGDTADVHRLFSSVRGLHSNFYEDDHNENRVLLGLQDANTVVELLKQEDLSSQYEFITVQPDTGGTEGG